MANTATWLNAVKGLFCCCKRPPGGEDGSAEKAEYYGGMISTENQLAVGEPSKANNNDDDGVGDVGLVTGPFRDGEEETCEMHGSVGGYVKLLKIVNAEREQVLARLADAERGGSEATAAMDNGRFATEQTVRSRRRHLLAWRIEQEMAFVEQLL